MKTSPSLRIHFQALSGETLSAKTTDNQEITLRCSPEQQQELHDWADALHPGTTLSALHLQTTDDDCLQAEFLVFEPDYLMDISVLAECFKPYGHHPLNYTLSRLKNHAVTAPILLGNAANFFIDEFVYEDARQPVDLPEALRKLFRTAAFEFTACADLQHPKTEAVFFEQCRTHFEHIRHAVQQFFPKAGIDKTQVVLEPSFIATALGVQGRLDLMLCDFSRFIELKSGKALEDFRTGGQFIRSAENHYIQMILYWATLEFNLNRPPDAVAPYLLYSKYPVLSKEQPSRKHLQAALTLRNRIVAGEYALQKANSVAVTRAWLAGIHSQNLNTKNLSGRLFEQYLAPEIDRFAHGFSQLKACEQSYFLRLYTFITKELWLSKAGEREYEGVRKAAVLWNAPLEDKLTTGELLYDLQIIENRAAEEDHSLTLSLPAYDDLYLPNFRPGDWIVLYERLSDADTVSNRQVFKGSIEALDARQLRIRLRYRQKNPLVWNADARYAVEHDYMDSTYTGMFRALRIFLDANADRRDLLLNQRPARPDELFLLVGPPGSGKTSIALKELTEREWEKGNTHILLLAYTNRAVDEICRALATIDARPPFFRIGSELNCHPDYRPHLMEKQLKDCRKRADVAAAIDRCRIFVGTVASVCARPELFALKHFHLAIVDEATQLLEPQLLGIFCAKDRVEKNAIDRFVLIGDHKQLPAVVLQTKAESRVAEPELNALGLTDLSDSLFERLYRQYKAEGRTDCLSLLSKQGRMHPDIAAFPSAHFYDGLLESAGLPHQLEKWPDRKRLHFYHVTPSGQDRSPKANRKEAEQVVAICRTLRADAADGHEKYPSIGIITPFRNQIALIRKLLQESDIDDVSDILVDTVERFQGSQCDVILYSFCIQTESQLAALPNCVEENGKCIDRKLNVALTRARKALYIIGNEGLLGKNPLYRDLIGYVREG
jgi:hypothetical protein